MRYQLHKWINTLAFEKGFKKRLLDIDKNARFLTFNYTDFWSRSMVLGGSR